MFASAFILTVLACSPNGLVCRPTVTEAQFASLDACQAAIGSTEDAVRASFPADTRFSFRGACAASEQAEHSGVAWAVSASGDLITSFDRLPAGSGVAVSAAAKEKAVDTTVTASIDDERAPEETFDSSRLLKRDPIVRGDRPSIPEQHAALDAEPLLYEMASR
jgi:hypothetical protein